MANNDRFVRGVSIAIGLAISFYGAGSGKPFYSWLGFAICSLSFLLL